MPCFTLPLNHFHQTLPDPVFPENEGEENVKEFLDGLEGDLTAEETCPLPIEVDDRKTVLKGVIDLIHVKNDAVEIIDHKTDRERTNEEEYGKQLSAYYGAADGVFEGKEVSAEIFHTYAGETKEIEPLSKGELRGVM